MKNQLNTDETDPNYVLPFAKLRDKNSYITENQNADKNYKFRGIYIDLFYFDRGNKFLSKLTVNIQKLVYVLTLIKNDKAGLIALIRNMLFFTVHKLIFPIIRLSTKLFGINTLVPPLGTGFSSKRDLNDIFPLQRISFEGRFFNAPFNTDSYLKKIYGNYMVVPQTDQRRVHTVITSVRE